MTITLERTKVPTTEEALVSMLTENTGRHFLDSGGAYGRAWERAQGRDVESYEAEPEAWVDSGQYVVLSAYHWLKARLEYDHKATEVLHRYADIFDPDSPWLATMEDFANTLRRGESYHDYLDGTVNSYNHEDSLTRTIQFVIVTPSWDRGDESAFIAGEPYVLLQIHGGCDVRGGYTAPKVFRLMCDPAYMFDFDSFEAECTRDPEEAGEPLPGMPTPQRHALSHRSGEIVEWSGSCATTRELWGEDRWDEESGMFPKDEDGDTYLRCPYCIDPTPMSVHGSYVG